MLNRLLTLLGTLGLCLLVAACGSTKIAGHKLNTEISALGQNSRIRHIVLHYTASNTADAIKTLSQKNVSSHYLITDENPPALYRLVDEQRRAWHAGLSQWYDHTDLNTSSIGIEIVNAGLQKDGTWAPYAPAQIALLKDLLHDLIQRHQIDATNIVAHSDIAPQRKIDPGPLFPWSVLATAGIGRWYDINKAQQQQLQLEIQGLPDYSEIQLLLKKAGYAITTHGNWDRASSHVMAAFQMHYRPTRYDGVPDAESIAILQTLFTPEKAP